MIKHRLFPKSLLKLADPMNPDLGLLFGKFNVLDRLPIVGNARIFMVSI